VKEIKDARVVAEAQQSETGNDEIRQWRRRFMEPEMRRSARLKEVKAGRPHLTPLSHDLEKMVFIHQEI
jgi:type II secretory pathway predicted ATPase ExeA